MCSNDWGYRLYFWILGPSSWDWQVVPKRRWGIATTRCVITQMCAVLLKPEIRLRVRRLVLRPTVILNTDRPLSQGRINYYARFFDTWFCFDVSLCVFMLGFAVLALLCSQGITVRIRLEDPRLCGFPHFSRQTPELHVAGTSLNGAAEDSNLLGCDTVTVRVVVDVSKGLSASIFMVLP